jgi:antirestriction protein ArdC
MDSVSSDEESRYVGDFENPAFGECLATWLQVLTDDKRALSIAVSHASKAIEYLYSLQPHASAESAIGERKWVPTCL